MNLYANESLFKAIERINDTTYLVCHVTPPHVVSDGIWGGRFDGRTVTKSSLPVFELQMLVIFAVTQICQFFFKFLDFPVFISQMMAGVILGPSIRQETLDKYKKVLFPYGSQDTLATVTSIGYVLFIFITAVQMDMSMITRTGYKAWAIAIIGLAAPSFIGVPTAVKLYPHLREHMGEQMLDLPVVVVSQTILSFAVIVSLLNELKITNSELGRLALSSALVSDVLSITAASLATSVHYNASKLSLLHTAYAIAIAVFVLLICRPAMFWIIRRTPEGRSVNNGYIYLIIIMVFALGCVAIQIGQDFIIGAFVLGMAVPEGPPLGSALVKKLHFIGNCIFLPIFVTCGVMKADFSLVDASTSTLIVGVFVVFTHVIKVIACIATALLCNMPFRDALVLALILNCKGIVELCMYSGLYDGKVIRRKTYGEMMISIMIIAITVKWSVKYLYDPSRKYAGYQKRNIMNLKPGSELRILACIHKKYHIHAITDVLDLCCPTIEHPIIVDALHLIELVGRASPVFITHRHQKVVSGSEKSYSDGVILAFDLYEHDNRGAATTHTYTALSPRTLMYEDVCQVALDKVASLVILPFHKRWSSDGAVEYDDKNIRSLNFKLLEIAPCSVGILVSRSSFQTDSYIRLAMVYLGGQDDREALCLAKRAMRDPKVNLVVYHLVLEEYIPDFEDLLDHEVLEDVKRPPSGMGNVRYLKVITNDGSETSGIIHDIVSKHDFFIVGRRYGVDTPQTEGLVNWSEFPELGAIGDLLASPDLASRASILVVQQQESKTNSRRKF